MTGRPWWRWVLDAVVVAVAWVVLFGLLAVVLSAQGAP